MGNQLIKNVDLEKEVNCQAGHNGLWSVYSATKQDTSKTKVSVFTVDKTKWETKKNKQQSDDLTNFVKREYQNLVRYKHPYILGVVESLVESPKVMAFATENVRTSLFQAYSDNSYDTVYPSELQFKIAVLDLCESIKFFHSSLNQPFLSIYPENIYITESQKWKLGAPLFSQSGQSDLNIEFNSVQSIQLYPNLSFTAPEVLEKKNIKQSDIFSLGLVICSILKSKYDKSCYNNKLFTASDLPEHQIQISNLQKTVSSQDFWKLINNNEFKQLVVKMIDPNPQKRPPIEIIIQNSYLNDQFVQILKHLENFYSFEPHIQIKFLKEFEKAVLNFSKSLVCSQILPKLMIHFQDDKLMPSILQIIIQVVQNNLLDSDDFQQIVWKNHLRNIQSLREVPAQALYLIVDKIELLLDLVDKVEIQNQIMPLFMKCYECSISKLQIKAIQSSITLFDKLDQSFIKAKVFPKLLQMCLSNIQDLRLQALHTIHHVLSHLDSNSNQELLKILLKAFQNSSSQIRMLILQIYQKMAENIELVQINENILPSLIIKLTDFSLSKQEFELYYKSIQQMINKIYTKRLQDDHFQQTQGEYDAETIIKQLDQQLQPVQVNNTQQPFNFDFLNVTGAGDLCQLSGQQVGQQQDQSNSNKNQLNGIQFDNGNGNDINFNSNANHDLNFNSNANHDIINNVFYDQINNQSNHNVTNQSNFNYNHTNQSNFTNNQNKIKNLNLKFNRNNTTSNNVQNTASMNSQFNSNPFENKALSNQNSQMNSNLDNVNWNLDQNNDFFSEFNIQNNKQQNKTLNIQKNAWNQDDDLI